MIRQAPNGLPRAETKNTTHLERAWERYREYAQEAAKTEGEARAKVHEALHGHLNALFEIAGRAAA